MVQTEVTIALNTEAAQDIVGAMFRGGNTESNITVTYEDSDGTIDLADHWWWFCIRSI